MTKKSKRFELTERAIRSMPYDLRIRNYEREKDQMFSRIAGLPAEEVSRMHRELAEKWKV